MANQGGVSVPDDTGIGGEGDRFPSTHWSAIEAARSDDPQQRRRAFETIVQAYWKPVYKYVRIHWRRSNEDAKDLTQSFFTRLIEKDDLAAYDPSRARLRTFVRVCVDRFVMNADKEARRLKRGGGALTSLDFEAAEGELARMHPQAPGSPDELFEKEWIRSLFGLAVDDLREECSRVGRDTQFRLFELYDLEGEEGERRSYQDLANEFGLKVTDVTNYLASARRGFRRHALARLRDMTASDEEFRREAQSLMGVEVE